MKYQIQNMTCGGCARHVTEAIKGVDPEAAVTVNLAQRTAEVQSTAVETSISQALEEAGYPVRKV
jgi:copper chaperone